MADHIQNLAKQITEKYTRTQNSVDMTSSPKNSTDQKNTPRDIFDPEAMNYYEKLYFFEMEAREKLVTRAQIPIALIISTLTAIAYLSSNTNTDQITRPLVLFYLFITATTCLSLISIFFTKKLLSGHTYLFLPSALTLEKFRKDCIAKFSSVPDSEKWLESWTNISFKQELCERLIECANHNFYINKERFRLFWRAIGFTTISAALLFISFAIFFLGNLKTNPIHNVKIIEKTISNHNEQPVQLFGLRGIENTLMEEFHERYQNPTTTPTAR